MAQNERSSATKPAAPCRKVVACIAQCATTVPSSHRFVSNVSAMPARNGETGYASPQARMSSEGEAVWLYSGCLPV